MARNKQPKVPEAPKTHASSQLFGVEILGSPNLMEAEIKFVRDHGIQLKAIVDETLEKGSCRVIKRVIKSGRIIFSQEENIPLDPVMGSTAALDFYDSITLGELDE